MSHLSYNTQINKTNHVRFTDPDAVVVREREFLFQMGDQLSGMEGKNVLAKSTQQFLINKPAQFQNAAWAATLSLK